jgi:hypothetical protein
MAWPPSASQRSSNAGERVSKHAACALPAHVSSVEHRRVHTPHRHACSPQSSS